MALWIMWNHASNVGRKSRVLSSLAVISAETSILKLFMSRLYLLDPMLRGAG
jgi:hypothetical protein